MAVTEMVYDPKLGLVWALMPAQYSVSFIIGKSDMGGMLQGRLFHCGLSSLKMTHELVAM